MDNIYGNKLADAAYNSAAVSFYSTGSFRSEDAPLELIKIFRRGIKDYVQKNPDSTTFHLRDVALPVSEYTPTFLIDSTVTVGEGGYKISDDILDIDIDIPLSDRRVGMIPDAEFTINDEFPLLPNAVLSDERLDLADKEVQKLFKKDRTRGLELRYRNRIPEQVKEDPLGADFTGQMELVNE